MCLFIANIICFSFALQLKAKIGESQPQEVQIPSSAGACNVNDSRPFPEKFSEFNSPQMNLSDDEDEPVVSQIVTPQIPTTSKDPDPPFPVVSTPAQRGRRKSRTGTTRQGACASASETELLQMLTTRAVESEMLKRKLDDLISTSDVVKQEKVNWGQWMASCVAQVPDNRWAEFTDRSLPFLREFVHLSDPITTCASTTTTTSATITSSASTFRSPIASTGTSTSTASGAQYPSAPPPSGLPPLYGGHYNSYGYQSPFQPYVSQQHYGGPYPGGSGQYHPDRQHSYEQSRQYSPLNLRSNPSVQSGTPRPVTQVCSTTTLTNLTPSPALSNISTPVIPDSADVSRLGDNLLSPTTLTEVLTSLNNEDSSV